MNLWKQFVLPLITLFAVIAIGIAGFVFIDKYSFLEAAYMVVVTLTTVGFRPVKDMSTAGMIFDMTFVLVGVGVIIFVVGRALELLVSGELMGIRRRRKMKQLISEMKNHYIICGFGRVGHQVAVEFEAAKIPYVVLDQKTETAAEMEPKGIPYLIGDITSDVMLEEAGIKRAKGLIASADSDADNVFVVLSARVMNPNLYIVARAAYPQAEEKLKKAGANRVVSPYFISGKRMAAMTLKPVAMDYLDTVLHSEHVEMGMREFKVNGKCRAVNKTLKDAEIRQKSGAYIMAVRKPDGKFNLQPVAETVITEGDVLVAIGTPKQLDLLEACLNG